MYCELYNKLCALYCICARIVRVRVTVIIVSTTCILLQHVQQIIYLLFLWFCTPHNTTNTIRMRMMIKARPHTTATITAVLLSDEEDELAANVSTDKLLNDK